MRPFLPVFPLSAFLFSRHLPGSNTELHQMKTSFFALATVALIITACGKPPPTQTSNALELPLTGAELWSMGGSNFNVEGTAALLLRNGQTLLVVKALCDFQANASHRAIAQALAKYAIDHGYQNALTNGLGSSPRRPFSGSVGVALTRRKTIGSVAASTGYRYNFTITELQAQAATSSASK